MLKIFTYSLFFSILVLSVFTAEAKKVRFYKMKAVLVVGNTEDNTKKDIAEMNKIANFLMSRGVHVMKFYNKQARWENIIKAAKDCNFFVYSGHGVREGKDGIVGGFRLTRVIGHKEASETLRFKKNALVYLKSVCFGAGSAVEDYDIGLEEAEFRSSQYAQLFFKAGAAAYFASNIVGDVPCFFQDFFKGATLKEIFEKTASIISHIEFEKPFSYNPSLKISMASSPGGWDMTIASYFKNEKTERHCVKPITYDLVYIGKPNFAIYYMKK